MNSDINFLLHEFLYSSSFMALSFFSWHMSIQSSINYWRFSSITSFIESITFLTFLWAAILSKHFSSLLMGFFSTIFILTLWESRAGPLFSFEKSISFFLSIILLDTSFSWSLSISSKFPFYKLFVMLLKQLIRHFIFSETNSLMHFKSWYDLSSILYPRIFWQKCLSLRYFW